MLRLTLPRSVYRLQSRTMNRRGQRMFHMLAHVEPAYALREPQLSRDQRRRVLSSGVGTSKQFRIDDIN